HGALATPDGRIRVSWSAGTGRAVELEWRESGGPPARTPTRVGFGSRLIDSLAGQLGARVEREWRREGLVVRLAMQSGLIADPGEAAGLDVANAPTAPGLNGRRVLVVEDEA